MEINKYIELAKEAKRNAYAPYSKYQVGAILKAKSRKILFRL